MSSDTVALEEVAAVISKEHQLIFVLYARSTDLDIDVVHKGDNG